MDTIYNCGKCGRSSQGAELDQMGRPAGWLIARRVNTAEARAKGWMVIRCPEHTTAYARRIAGLPQQARKANRPDYAQFVHEFTDEHGATRYAVGRWVPERSHYFRPFDATEARLTGCSGEYARRPSAMQNYATRKKALARARYLWRDEFDLLDYIRRFESGDTLPSD